jgi:hypothetical protein
MEYAPTASSTFSKKRKLSCQNNWFQHRWNVTANKKEQQHASRHFKRTMGIYREGKWMFFTFFDNTERWISCLNFEKQRDGWLSHCLIASSKKSKKRKLSLNQETKSFQLAIQLTDIWRSLPRLFNARFFLQLVPTRRRNNFNLTLIWNRVQKISSLSAFSLSQFWGRSTANDFADPMLNTGYCANSYL